MGISRKGVEFDVLSKWWADHAYGRQMYIGHGIYRAMEPRSYAWKNAKELPNQIKRIREFSTIQGSVYFSSKSFADNPNGWSDSLRNNYYKYPAIPPPMSWIDATIPQRPVLLYDSSKSVSNLNSIELYFRQEEPNEMINRYVIYQFSDPKNMDKNDPKNIKEIINSGNNFYAFDLKTISADQNKVVIAATSLSSTNNESDLGRYIYLERRTNGWQIIALPENK